LMKQHPRFALEQLTLIDWTFVSNKRMLLPVLFPNKNNPWSTRSRTDHTTRTVLHDVVIVNQNNSLFPPVYQSHRGTRRVVILTSWFRFPSHVAIVTHESSKRLSLVFPVMTLSW
jgi:hypothetical protein